MSNTELDRARRENKKAAAKLARLRDQVKEQAEVCRQLNVEVRRLGGLREELVDNPFSHGEVSRIMREAGLSGKRKKRTETEK